MPNTLFRCPNTGMNVQHFVAESSSGDEHEAIVALNCPACARIHLVNAATGEPARDAGSR
jgi:hypothetical protein